MTPVLVGDRRSARPKKGFTISSSRSVWSGGGKGRGCGLVGVRRGSCAPSVLPPTLLTGDLGAPCWIAWGAARVSGAALDDSATWPDGDGPEPSSSGWRSLDAAGAVSTSGFSSGVVGRDAGRWSDLRDTVSRRRLRISGLCLARLDVVGDATEGLWGEREGRSCSCCCGCNCSSC